MILSVEHNFPLIFFACTFYLLSFYTNACHHDSGSRPFNLLLSFYEKGIEHFFKCSCRHKRPNCISRIVRTMKHPVMPFVRKRKKNQSFRKWEKMKARIDEERCKINSIVCWKSIYQYEKAQFLFVCQLLFRFICVFHISFSPMEGTGLWKMKIRMDASVGRDLISLEWRAKKKRKTLTKEVPRALKFSCSLKSWMYLIFLYSHSILSCSWFHHLIYIIVTVYRNFFPSPTERCERVFFVALVVIVCVCVCLCVESNLFQKTLFSIPFSTIFHCPFLMYTYTYVWSLSFDSFGCELS